MKGTNTALFPFPSIREGQREFMEDVKDAVEGGKILVAHAPTGIGKTVATLVPALEYAVENGKTIFFLTSKRSQHKIAIDTVRLIKDHAKREFTTVDITSKQSMCPRTKPIHREFYFLFNEFCRSEQKNKRCRYFIKQDEEALRRIKSEIMHVEQLCNWCTNRGVCPYKVALEAAGSADVLVCDYNYLFSTDITERVLEKIEKGLEDLIVIVDEAHNLPDRIRSNLSSELRMNTVTSIARDLRRIDREMQGNLMGLESIFKKLAMSASKENKDEMKVDRDFLVDEMAKVLGRGRIEAMSYDDFVNSLRSFAEDFETSGSRTTDDMRYKNEMLQRDLLSVADFLDGWKTGEECVRIFSLTQKEYPRLYFKLLDPSVISEPIFAKAHSTILMSGTLCPTEMYADVLGASPARIKGKEIVLNEYKSPFPSENRMIVVTKALTTKYTKRGEEMYRQMAGKIGEVAKYVKGGMAVFFPSYALLNSVAAYIPDAIRGRVMVERREMGKEEKNRLYETLRDDTDGILLAVQGGSFSEGMDYESNTLKAIIVVGLPLSPPTLEVKMIEGYYVRKYGAETGRNYGYLYPAITKVLQAAGRGIRSEQDRCIIVLMDYRFAQYPYKKCLPSDFDVTYTGRSEEYCKTFFR
uniref:ATP-dependent DNA helicase n=1 Tax=Candidatus Methanophaga sp. ANME-1 ERB7 TaxID=2759913 RepID=A0A7G9Z565_9EURY|nr:ATP-dependent DNA helicase [Methanosarcinales archaeon ANME-1 ERB7]